MLWSTTPSTDGISAGTHASAGGECPCLSSPALMAGAYSLAQLTFINGHCCGNKNHILGSEKGVEYSELSVNLKSELISMETLYAKYKGAGRLVF